MKAAESYVLGSAGQAERLTGRVIATVLFVPKPATAVSCHQFRNNF